MKTLKDILEVYQAKSKDERRFVDKHIVVKHKDRNGNGDDVFQATNIKAVGRKDERHGYDPNEDEKVYEEVEQVDEGNRTNKMMKKFDEIGKGVKKLGPEKLRQAQIDSPDKSIKGQSKAVTDAAKRAARNEEVEYVEEAGPFSYGKPPRKGSVAYYAAMKRKEDEKKTKPIEPRDQMIGNARVTKTNEETEHLEEKLKVSDGVGKWISDFVHSDNPKFAGKSKKERTQMALGAFYSAKRGE